MARETRVGLLAGLGFIILFAVILANRGRPNRSDTALPYLVDRGTHQVDRRGDIMARDVRHPRRAATRRSTRAVDPSNSSSHELRRSPYASDVRDDLDASANNMAPVANRDFDRGTSRRRASRVHDVATEDADHPAQVVDELPRGRTSAPPLASTGNLSHEELRRRLDALMNGYTKKVAFEAEQREAAAEDPVRSNLKEQGRSSVPAKRYKIQSGDTLTRIATEQYGRASRQILDAIFDANRGGLSSPDALKIGVEIVLPVLAESAKAALSTKRSTSDAASTDVRRGSGDVGAFVWYQVVEGDTYSSIAREKLDSAKRWHEIDALNKDKFPDAGRIRPGVRIKLPARRPTSGGNRP